MTYIPSAFAKNEDRVDRIPIVFGIILPTGDVLTDYFLYSHVNPLSFDERMSQKIERIQTKAGWIEQHWGREMTEISATQTTGAFINPKLGLTGEAILRRESIGYDRFKDLVELYRNNGSVYDQSGKILFQGRVFINYSSQMEERRFEGYFTGFDVNEIAEKPWAFELSWAFKVEKGVTSVGYQEEVLL